MKAYYGSRLSPNMTETPEGYLICMNVPIARTGTQQYLRYELGLEDHPNDLVTVYRTEDEVFSTATIASFEGKPVTDDHPPSGVYADNITAFDNGHAQNVRRGVGDMRDLLIADLFITSPKLIEAIRNGRREVSCGYDCDYVERDGKLYQSGIRGNHVAVVESGRAGSRVAIKDSATKRNDNERSHLKMTKKHSIFASIFSRAVKDMEPEEVADAIEELTKAGEEEQDELPVQQAAPTPAPFAQPKEDAEPDLTVLKDAIDALTEKVNALTAAKEADAVPEADPLQKLEDELTTGQEVDPAENEEAVTVPADEIPEELQDEDGPEAAQTELPDNPIPGADTAAAMKALQAIKPVIASLPKAQRKAAADRAVAEIRRLMGRDARPSTNGYQGINNVIRQAAKGRAKDSAPKQDNGELGKKIMASRNPHYKK